MIIDHQEEFSSLLMEDNGQTAGIIHVLRARDLTAWRATLTAADQQVVDLHRFMAKPDEVVLLGTHHHHIRAAVGVPDCTDLGPWDLAAAAAQLPAGHYRLALADDLVVTRAWLGWLLAQYHYDRYREAITPIGPRRLLCTDLQAVKDMIAIAAATALVRDLVTTPANDLGPSELETVVRTIGKQYAAQVTSIIGDDLLARNLPTIHMVGRAAADPPRLIELRWGEPAHPKLTLVGKGVTFDSGGLDVKSASGMALMKKDMGGAAHALALACLIMQARLPVRLQLLIPAVENAISGNAFRPGDVVVTRSGISVEIGNTDAEGRLILADALTLAESETPELLIDFATLTGAARVALGPELPALFTPDDVLAADLAKHAHMVSDPHWRMPLWAPYGELLKSMIADINNASESSFAGCITAALFLQKFVSDRCAWVHVDLYAWNGHARPGRPKGGEAMTLRSFWSYLHSRYMPSA